MGSKELFENFVFEYYNDFDRTKNREEIAGLDDMGDGIMPLGQFIDFLQALYDEQGEDKQYTYLRSRDAGGDSWYKTLSVVIQKDKSAEELEKMEADRQAAIKAEANRERQTYLRLKAKYEPSE